MVTDGKTIRLRASCNTCNECKVRCSQHKPTCARCERNGNKCTYGLSRRTHKDAPPISAPPTQRRRRCSFNVNAKSNSQWRGVSFSKSPTDTLSHSSASPDRLARTRDASLPCDYMSSSGSPPMARSLQHNDVIVAVSQAPMVSDPTICPPELLPDFDCIVDSLSASGTLLPTPIAQDADSRIAGSHSGGINTNNSDATNDMVLFNLRQTTPTDPMTVLSLPDCGKCSCHFRVTELLASIRCGDDNYHHRRLSLDAQLAKLIQCIASSKTSIECTHGREDAEPIHIMAVATLIGYVIDEFRILASEPQLRRSLSSEKTVLENTEKENHLSPDPEESVFGKTPFVEPQLSWGVLELEEDDEVDLRLRLCMLSFRKLERLLVQLTLFLQNMHDAWAEPSCPSRYMSFVIACDYTRLLLEKKAMDVRKLFSVAAEKQNGELALI